MTDTLQEMVHRVKSFLLYSVIMVATFGSLPENAYQDMPLDFYTSLQGHFPWATEHRAELIRTQAQKYNINPYLIAAIIERESGGRAHLQGPLRSVKLYRRGELVLETHRAIGLMQVMSFYAPRAKLFNEQYNISLGAKILHRCLSAEPNLTESLRCYNSGANSKVYNYPYINDVLYSFGHLNGRERLYVWRAELQASSVLTQ